MQPFIKCDEIATDNLNIYGRGQVKNSWNAKARSKLFNLSKHLLFEYSGQIQNSFSFLAESPVGVHF